MLTSFCGGRVFGAHMGVGDAGAVAFPGWRRTHEDFVELAGKLPFALIAVDLPGFGSSGPPPSAWSTSDYAACLFDVVAEVIEEVGGPVVIIGHSFGGRVAVRLAAAHPDLDAALVLTGVPLVRDPDAPSRRRTPIRFRLARSLNRHGLVSDSRMEEARRRFGSSDYRATEGVMRDVLVKAVNETYEDALDSLALPVELVWGDRDTEVPVAIAEAVVERLDTAHLELCPDVGHFVPTSAPDLLAAAVVRAAARVGRTVPGT